MFEFPAVYFGTLQSITTNHSDLIVSKCTLSTPDIIAIDLMCHVRERDHRRL